MNMNRSSRDTVVNKPLTVARPPEQMNNEEKIKRLERIRSSILSSEKSCLRVLGLVFHSIISGKEVNAEMLLNFCNLATEKNQ
jgi:hypothetical protein